MAALHASCRVTCFDHNHAQSIKERRSLGAALVKLRARTGAPLGWKIESASGSAARKKAGAQAKSAALQIFRFDTKIYQSQRPKSNLKMKIFCSLCSLGSLISEEIWRSWKPHFLVRRFERLCNISRKSSIFESARESGALFFYERERERRSEAKLRARAGAALGKIGGERERERRSKN